jgi:ribosomal protein S18 acetylase RimI-like enzyme
MVVFQRLAAKDWRRLRDVRLIALQESPECFLSTHKKELEYREKRWQAEFNRGEWTIGSIDGADVCLLGVTREEQTPQDERYLEYMWVDPRQRGAGIAFRLVTHELIRLYEAHVRLVRLWVLNGNNPAVSLYKSLSFDFNGMDQPLKDRPWRKEEQMDLLLTQELLGEACRRQHPVTAS